MSVFEHSPDHAGHLYFGPEFSESLRDEEKRVCTFENKRKAICNSPYCKKLPSGTYRCEKHDEAHQAEKKRKREEKKQRDAEALDLIQERKRNGPYALQTDNGQGVSHVSSDYDSKDSFIDNEDEEEHVSRRRLARASSESESDDGAGWGRPV